MEFLNLENKSFNNFYFSIRAANQLWDKEKFKLSCEIASVMWLWDPKNILGAQCVTNGCHLWKMTYHYIWSPKKIMTSKDCIHIVPKEP